MTAVPGPLSGLRVLAIEHMIALPFATQLLARLGAEVIKIEPIGTGEAGRASQPQVPDASGAMVGPIFVRSNLGKKSLAVNLRKPEGIALVRRLLPSFDVLAENMRPGVLGRLGLGYQAVAEVAPRLVYVSVSGFGHDPASPYRDWPAYAPVAEAMTGLYELSRPPGRGPQPSVAGALGDVGAALFAAVGTLAALRQRDRTGTGQHVDVPMFDAMLAINDAPLELWSLGAPVEMAAGRGVGVMSSFRATDGYFIVSAIREHMFERLCDVLGHREWLSDPRLATRRAWFERTDDIIRPAIEEWARDKTKLEASRLLAAAGVVAGPSNEPADVAADPHVRARGLVSAAAGLASADPVLVVGSPIRLSAHPAPTDGPLPSVGEHTRPVLAGLLGLGDDALDELIAAGVVA